MSRAARAFDRGEPDVAYMQARLTREARDSCLSYGIPPDTLGYRQCVASQIDLRTGTLPTRYYVPPTTYVIRTYE